ncbi:MAG: hypothetical protein H6Q65_893 [Firmicutes bacterium]|nr:hypothetical protein [Bacillota bacterium]
MTIAITIKVNDGVVMATDSAATIFSGVGRADYIYDNANKLFNLYKGLPIGAQVAGLGSIGQASIGTLVKDFRKLITTPNTSFSIDRCQYTIQDVAEKFKRFIVDDHYNQAFNGVPVDQRPYIGFHIAGYSSGQPFAETWKICVVQGQCAGPTLVTSQTQTGACWDGEFEPVFRLMCGFGTGIFEILKAHGIDDAKIQEIVDQCRVDLDAGFVTAPMPIQDAAELAVFLAEMAVKWAKYRPGVNSIGGPIDVAAITKHEGFKWIKRKHYFEPALNLKEGFGDA